MSGCKPASHGRGGRGLKEGLPVSQKNSGEQAKALQNDIHNTCLFLVHVATSLIHGGRRANMFVCVAGYCASVPRGASICCLLRGSLLVASSTKVEKLR